MPRVSRTEAEARQDAEFGPQFLEALARGLRVIHAFDSRKQQMTLSEVAKIVSLPRATVSRSLYTLMRLGYVSEEGKRFQLTPKILSLATCYLSSNSLSSVLQPAVERISAALKESSMAGVLDGENFVLIARATPPQTMTLNMGIGSQLPAISSAIGRVLLSARSDADIDGLLSKADPRQITRHTVLSKAKIRDEIVKVRSQGYSLVEDEVVVGFRSIAVPIRNYDDRVVAALNVGVHSDRISLATSLKKHLPLLLREAASLGRQLV